MPATNPKGLTYAGWALTSLSALMFLASGVMKAMHRPEVVKGFAEFGYPESTVVPIGLTEMLCAVLYLLPPTSALGAVLLTAYLGGAVATHVHAGQGFVLPVILGVLVWGGLFGRDSRVRELLPVRR